MWFEFEVVFVGLFEKKDERRMDVVFWLGELRVRVLVKIFFWRQRLKRQRLLLVLAQRPQLVFVLTQGPLQLLV